MEQGEFENLLFLIVFILGVLLTAEFIEPLSLKFYKFIGRVVNDFEAKKSGKAEIRGDSMKVSIKYHEFYVIDAGHPDIKKAHTEKLFFGTKEWGVLLTNEPHLVEINESDKILKRVISAIKYGHIPGRQIVINPEGEKTNERIE